MSSVVLYYNLRHSRLHSRRHMPDSPHMNHHQPVALTDSFPSVSFSKY